MGSQEGGGLGGHWGFLSRDLEDRVILDVMDNFFFPNDDTLKVLCWYLYWKCVRKGGVLHVGTWVTFRVPDRRLGGQGYTWQTQRIIYVKFCVNIFNVGWNMRSVIQIYIRCKTNSQEVRTNNKCHLIYKSHKKRRVHKCSSGKRSILRKDDTTEILVSYIFTMGLLLPTSM